MHPIIFLAFDLFCASNLGKKQLAGKFKFFVGFVVRLKPGGKTGCLFEFATVLQ
jgi:hypothetical protein